MKRGTNGEIDCGPSRTTRHVGEERGTSKQRAATGPMSGSTLTAVPRTRQTKCQICGQAFTAVVGAGAQSCDACRAADINSDAARRSAATTAALEDAARSLRYAEALAKFKSRGPRP